MKPIVTAITDRYTYANDDYAKIHGERKRKPTFYRHEDGSEYHYIQGAIAWPASGPGCALVVGVTREDQPRYKILEASFNNYPRNLLRGCFDLKEKYTPEENLKLMQHWIGEDLFGPFLSEINQNQKLKLFFVPPPDIEQSNSDQILIEKIRTISEAGRLTIEPRNVSDELKGMTSGDAEKHLTSFPAVAAVGYALHYLTVYRPWLGGGGCPVNSDSF